MPYQPEYPVADISPDLAAYLVRELGRVSIALESVDKLQLTVLSVEPEKPRDGMIILADGINFDPGSGAGFYGRTAGSWVPLGRGSFALAPAAAQLGVSTTAPEVVIA